MYSVQSRRRRGFTLMEVLLVLVILAILGSLAALSYETMSRRANKKAAESQIGLFKTPIQMYQMAIASYPPSLEALRSAPGDLPNPAKWDGPYLDSPVPLDPWDRPYQYVFPGTHNPDGYDLWSFGPDGVNGTEDDIGNWNLERRR